MQTLPTAPDDGDAGVAIAATGEKATQTRNPQQGLGDRGGLSRWRGGALEMSIQRTPFGFGQDLRARRLGGMTSHLGQPQDAPGNQTIECQQAHQTSLRFELRSFEATAGFEGLMKEFN